MTQGLKVLPALLEDQNLVPSPTTGSSGLPIILIPGIQPCFCPHTFKVLNSEMSYYTFQNIYEINVDSNRYIYIIRNVYVLNIR